MNPMVYLFLMFGGGLFLIISFLLGEISDFLGDIGGGILEGLDNVFESIGLDLVPEVDVGDVGVEGEFPGPFSIRSIAAFITFFGASGNLSRILGIRQESVFIASVGAGLVGGLIVWGFTYLIAAQAGSSMPQKSDYIGQIGRVVLPITAEKRGIVSLEIRGQHKEKPARTETGEGFSKGDQVRVVKRIGGVLYVASVVDNG